MNSSAKTVMFWAVILLSAFLLWQTVKSGGSSQTVPEISYSDFLTKVASGQVSRVTIAGSIVRGLDAKGGSFRFVAPANQTAMLDALQQHGVDIWFKDVPEQNWSNWIVNLVPVLLLAVLWIFMIRQMRGRRAGSGGPSTYMPTQDSSPRFGP